MPAMIRPISVKHPYLGDRRLPLFNIFEIVAAQQQVLITHSKVHFRDQFPQFAISHRNKSMNALYIFRYQRFQTQGFRYFKRRLTRFHLIYAIIFNFLKFIIAYVTSQHENFRSTNNWFFTLSQYLQTLGSPICSLVVLAR